MTHAGRIKKPSIFTRLSYTDKVFTVFNICFWVVILFVIIYPMYVIVIASISSPEAVWRGEVFFRPIDPSLVGYRAIFGYSLLWRSYLNSIVYTVVGTTLSVFVTMMGAFALSHKFFGKPVINFFIVFTMFFSGGLIPTFLLMRDIGLYNNPLIMILMGTVSVWNLMVARTYISTSIPKELQESAFIDGANYFSIFFKIILPLSSTIVAVLCIFYAVATWNDFFTGLVFLRTRTLMPLQTVLREILASLQINQDIMSEMFTAIDDPIHQADALRIAEVVKYCAIVISTVPAIILYVTMQDYFRKGVMIGSIKG